VDRFPKYWGLLLFAAVGLVALALNATPAAAATATVTVSPTAVPAGGTVTISGSVDPTVCPVSDPVTLTDTAVFPPDGFGPTVERDSTGAFSTSYTVPASTPVGSYNIGLRCGGGDTGVFATLQVTRPWAAVAEGGDGAAWYLSSASDWSSLGGSVLTTPTVTSYANNPYGAPVPIFVAIGTDHQVWVTSVGSAPTWYPVGGYCLSSPAAGIFDSASGGQDDLTIACEGGNGAMWVEDVLIAAAGPSNNPVPVRILQGFTSYGGNIGAGPTIDDVPNTGPVFFAEAPSGQVYYESQPNSWTATYFFCTGHLAGGALLGDTVLGCQGGDGQMWLVTTSNGTLAGMTASPQGGALIGGPGLASGSSTFMFAEGTNHSAYEEVAGTTSWVSLGGYLLGDGINATSL
jgi:hypothetical protein